MASEKTLIDYLQQIPDFRSPKGRRHPLWFVLLVIIMGMMSGYYGYRGLGRFVERHRRALSEAFKIPGARVPSYSTLRRVMLGLDYTQLRDIFNDWATTELNLPLGEWLAVDAKCLGNTVSGSNQTDSNEEAELDFVSLISVFSQQRGLVLGVQELTERGGAEIPWVQTLLEALELEGYVFSLDALHCQKKTVESIVDSGNDYLIQVKRNQLSLHGAIEAHSEISPPVQVHQSHEQCRTRITTRQIEVFEPPPDLDPDWQGVGCVIRVKRFGTRGSKPYHSLSYYICSLDARSRQLEAGIRGHWCIENRLHWVKDVIYREDTSPQKSGLAPLNFSLLKTWVLTLLRSLGFDSIRAVADQISHNLPFLLSICT